MKELYYGDCLEILKTLPDNSVDMVLTDPPYGIDFQSNRRWGRFAKILNDKTPFVEFIQHLPRILKPEGCAMIFTKWDKQQVFIDELIKHGLKPKNILIWDKVVHGMGDLKRAFGSRYESIIFVANNEFRFNGKRPTDIVQCMKINAQHLIHPNQKPVALLENLIEKCTKENQTVLDCFMGSGSTGIACLNTNRKFIGIELDKKYFDMAQSRIKGCKLL
ncbi:MULTISPECIES: site-specific DNA-methyltransferase [unclassified Moraxella]|uniref:DNA-methyltransferase n=1 Tax=unclassified Moraxella TaxID=2685852 RepID=UPI002B40F9ED|nr:MULTISPECIES: site-specific DNA-methyltransferase [unclassified Moraxella]